MACVVLCLLCVMHLYDGGRSGRLGQQLCKYLGETLQQVIADSLCLPIVCYTVSCDNCIGGGRACNTTTTKKERRKRTNNQAKIEQPRQMHDPTNTNPQNNNCQHRSSPCIEVGPIAHPTKNTMLHDLACFCLYVRASVCRSVCLFMRPSVRPSAICSSNLCIVCAICLSV